MLYLRMKLSRIGMNHSLYDDFSYVHYHFNDDSEYIEERLRPSQTVD